MKLFKPVALLFDLDGTLVDSRQDLTTAINLMLKENSFSPLTVEQVGECIGDGARVLVEKVLRKSSNDKFQDFQVEQNLKIFMENYSKHFLDSTVLYPGVIEVLEYFFETPKAVVTNKPYYFSVKILENLNILKYFTAVIGGDSCKQRKPYPDQIITALEICKIKSVSASVMIGDSSNDILAGKAAETYTVGVNYGFGSRRELINSQADLIIEVFSELPNYFGKLES